MLIYNKKPPVFFGPRAISHHTEKDLPILTLVGKSNAGKSTLFNHLTQSKNALTGDIFGLTRDRRYGLGRYYNKNYIVVDTGGTDAFEIPFRKAIHQQIKIALAKTDYIGFVIDGTLSLSDQDYQFSQYLRTFNKKIILIVNKIEKFFKQHYFHTSFLELGFSETYYISATQGLGTEQLKKFITRLSSATATYDEKNAIKLTIVGRPNAGKSTLFNRLIQEERSLVSTIPGTTRDSTSVYFQFKNQSYVFIDTAGIRKSANIDSKFETDIVTQSLQAIHESQVVLFVIDACFGITDQDLRLLQLLVKLGPALIILFNKWDVVSLSAKENIKKDIQKQLHFVSFAFIQFISASTDKNLDKIFSLVQSVYQSATQKLHTSKLTQLLEKAVAAHSPPVVKNRNIKLRYAHLGGSNPLIVVIHGTHTRYILSSYKRYLENFYLRQLKIKGTPLHIVFKEK